VVIQYLDNKELDLIHALGWNNGLKFSAQVFVNSVLELEEAE